jgi:hypothetical protein
VSGISVFILTAGRTAKSLGHILLTGQPRRRPPEPLARPLREAFQRDDRFVNLLSLLAQVRKFFELRVIRRAWYIDVLIGKISSMTSNSGEIMELCAHLKCSGAPSLGWAWPTAPWMYEIFFLSIVLLAGEKRVNLAAARHHSSSGDLTSVVDRIG